MQPYSKDQSKRVLEFYWKRDDFVNPLPVRVSRNIVLSKRIIAGYYNKGYRDQIRKHQNATTQLNAEHVNWESIEGRLNIGFKWPFVGGPKSPKKEEIWGDIASSLRTIPFNPSDAANSNALSRAAASAYQAIREAQVAISGPTFIGEARETMKMLRRPAEGLHHLSKKWLDALKKRKGSHPTSWMQDISGLWLEQSFGWKPLFHDIQDGMKAWNRLFDTERITPFSGFGVQSTHQPVPTYSQGFNNYCYFLVNQRDISTQIVKIRGCVRATAKTGGRAQMELFGFTPSEFLPTAWELLPWSFLVDYFANIGDIISAGVTDTSGVIWTSRSTVQKYESTITTVPDIPKIKSIAGSNLEFAYGSASLCRMVRRRISRTRAFPLAVPDLYFTLPGSDGQLANIAALLGQANSLHRQSFRR